MFDNLRDDAASFYEEDTQIPEEEVKVVAAPKRRAAGIKILGMSPVQRFVIAVMLMIAVCSLGTMCLLLTDKIGF